MNASDSIAAAPGPQLSSSDGALGRGLRQKLKRASMPLVLFSAALFAAWLIPGHFMPWPAFQHEAAAGIAALLLCGAGLQSGAPVRWPSVALVALAMAAVPWLQYAFGLVHFVADAALPAVYLLTLALACTAAYNLAGSILRDQLILALAVALLAAATLSVGIATNQWLGDPALDGWAEEMPAGGRPFGNLGQPNHLASLIALGTAATLWLFEARRIGPIGAFVALAWLAWGLALTQSRTGWLAAIAIASCFLLLRKASALRTTRMAALLGLTYFFALVLLLPQLGGARHGLGEAGVGDGLAATGLRVEAGTRPTHWRVLLDAALSRPWFGFGWNQVSYAHFDFAPRHAPTGEMLQQSHNLLLDLIIYNGLPLGVLLFLGLLAWVRRTFISCKDGGSRALFAGMLCLLVHAMFEYPLHYLYFLLPAAVFAGVLHAKTSTASPVEAPAGLPMQRINFAVLAVSLAAVLTWIGVEYVKTEESVRRLRLAASRVMLTMADLRPIDTVLLDSWKAYHNAALIDLGTSWSPQEMQLLANTAHRHPYVPAVLRYAHALALSGSPEAATHALAYICVAHRTSSQEMARQAWHLLRGRFPQLGQVALPDCLR